MDDVVAMSIAGVDDELIITHVRANGMAAPLQQSDLIFLTQQRVSTRVIKAMQEPPPQPAQPVVYQRPAPPPVIVREYHRAPVYVAPPCHTPHYYSHRRHHRSGVGWGVSFHN